MHVPVGYKVDGMIAVYVFLLFAHHSFLLLYEAVRKPRRRAPPRTASNPLPLPCGGYTPGRAGGERDRRGPIGDNSNKLRANRTFQPVQPHDLLRGVVAVVVGVPFSRYLLAMLWYVATISVLYLARATTGIKLVHCNRKMPRDEQKRIPDTSSIKDTVVLSASVGVSHANQSTRRHSKAGGKVIGEDYKTKRQIRYAYRKLLFIFFRRQANEQKNNKFQENND